MIAAFAGYLVLVSMLFGIATWVTEQALSIRRWPRRFLWILTLAASVAFPLGMTLTARPTARTILAAPRAELSRRANGWDAVLPTRESPSGEVSRQAPPQQELASLPKREAGQKHFSLDQLVGGLWLASCAATLFWYAVVWFRVAALLRRAPSGRIDSTDVRVTEGIGPAVFGLLRPVIIWPAWLEQAPAGVRATVLVHEREHVAAHDPVLLGGGLVLVAFAPWNPVLWWQLQRMRFAIEADCDQRVLHAAGDPETYAQMLFRIAEQRSSTTSRLAILMSAPTWLERRIRLLLQPRRPLRIIAAACVPFGLAALIAAAQIPAPSLRGPELRKLPGEDMRPGADWARGIAESRYPELFDRHFDGTAVVAAVFDRYGTLKLAQEHLFAPGTPPSDFDMALEDRELGVDSTQDTLYGGGEYGAWTIGPWLETKNPGRLFIVYQVLQWAPDPSRTAARVRAALQAYAPELFRRAEDNSPLVEVTVFMNDDGSIDRLSKRTSPPLQQLGGGYAVERIAAMGIAKERLGRCGYFGSGLLLIYYCWPRRPDDARDIVDLDHGTISRGINSQYSSLEDSGDDGRIVNRYFPEIQAEGHRATTEEVNGHQALMSPWILFGRDGRVWGTGVFHSESRAYSGAIAQAIQARYPGVQIDGWAGPPLRVNGVPISESWIAPDSPIQKKSDVDLQKRKDVLVTGAVLWKVTFPVADSPFRDFLPAYFATGADFGVPTGAFHHDPGARAFSPLILLTVMNVDRQTLQISLRTPEGGPSLSKSAMGDPANWTQIKQLDVSYGQAATAEFDNGNQIVLRAERLKQ